MPLHLYFNIYLTQSTLVIFTLIYLMMETFMHIQEFNFLYSKRPSFSNQIPTHDTCTDTTAPKQLVPSTKNLSASHQPISAPPRLLDPFSQHNNAASMKLEQESASRQEALQIAAASMRKYLDNSTPGPYSWLIHTISDICSMEEQALQPTGFAFENTQHAAE